MRSGPERTGELSESDMVKILDGVLAEAKHIKVVVFAGGEPLLLGDALLAGIRTVKKYGAITRVVTNGYWATSLDEARRVVKMLRDAGLDEMNISSDDHHLPYISLQRVRYAYQASRELDFLSVAIANCGGPMSHLTPEALEAELAPLGAMDRRYNPDGTAIMQAWTPGTQKVLMSNSPLQRIGRGIDKIADEELPAGYPDLPDRGGCPWALRSAAISPSGHLLSCCGFELDGNPALDYGDLKSQPAADLLDAADDDVVTNLIGILGPPKLMDLLKRQWPDEVKFDKDYRSYCEVCWDLVHVPQNLEALLRHQGAFIDLVVEIREQLRELWGRENGEVVFPIDLVVYPHRELNEHARSFFPAP
jgi:hypothetical protein